MEKRRGGMRSVAAEVPRIAAPLLGKRGFGEAQLVTDWAAVIGSELAGRTSPEKLSFPRGERREGTLRLRVASGYALEVQHREPVLIERINAFFGYRAVARLVIVQAPIAAPRAPSAPLQRPLAAAEQEGLDRRVADIEDPTLREALRQLGRSVIGTVPR